MKLPMNRQVLTSQLTGRAARERPTAADRKCPKTLTVLASFIVALTMTPFQTVEAQAAATRWHLGGSTALVFPGQKVFERVDVGGQLATFIGYQGSSGMGLRARLSFSHHRDQSVGCVTVNGLGASIERFGNCGSDFAGLWSLGVEPIIRFLPESRISPLIAVRGHWMRRTGFNEGNGWGAGAGAGLSAALSRQLRLEIRIDGAYVRLPVNGDLVGGTTVALSVGVATTLH